jgi:pimeloyl-ACP methyl ester carboxylesterase
MTTALTRPELLDIETFARATGIHPELVRRLVALGVVDATRDREGELGFRRDQIAVATRAQRLRATFALNYAALGLVADLLDRIADLEQADRRRPRPKRGDRWISTT